MIQPRLVLCGGAAVSEADPRREGRLAIALDTAGGNANVNLKLSDVAGALCEEIRPRLVDLLEIATYVFAADCATNRGHGWADGGATEGWDRDFSFVIPVRDLPFWSNRDAIQQIERLLLFLTDDAFRFEFVAMATPPPTQQYLEVGESLNWPFVGMPRIVMFSGGLDSLAGAAGLLKTGARAALVSHRTNAIMNAQQQVLAKELQHRFPGQVIHVPIWANKDATLGRESTQRTRSFLYAALGASVADSLQADGVRFYENGILSLNLPVAEEALRARASRTTHPRTLNELQAFLSRVLGRTFAVDNPYLMHTKAEVVRELAIGGMPELIGKSVSCSHTMFRTKAQPHCGRCSQCIDRRIGVLAAGMGFNDPPSDYETDVFLGERNDRPDRSIAVDYVKHGMELHRMTEEEIASRFGAELSRAARYMPGRLTDAVAAMVALHKRHGDAVFQVVSRQLGVAAPLALEGKVPPNSLVGLVHQNEHSRESWVRLCGRIVEALQVGLPRACQSQKPDNEPRLQEICDGLLKAAGIDLEREFPFLRWAVVMTKPDWSADGVGLLVELKYVRDRKGIGSIAKDIAEDITKYGHSGRRVLFVVYDPGHIVLQEDELAACVAEQRDMRLAVVR